MSLTNRELYEQAKRVIRGNHPEWGNFVLACGRCGTSWPDNAEMGMVGTHFEISHGEVVKAGGTLDIQLDLVWIGEGPPPRARPA